MKLYRLVDKNRQSYRGFQWPAAGTGEVIAALDWDPDPTIDCGKGLCGAEIGGDLNWIYVIEEEGGCLQVILTIGHLVKSFNGNFWRFQQCVVNEEYDIYSSEARQILFSHSNWKQQYSVLADKLIQNEQDEIIAGIYRVWLRLHNSAKYLARGKNKQ